MTPMMPAEKPKFAFSAAGSIGDPVWGFAVKGRDDLVTHHHRADIPPGLFDIFLDIKDRVLD